MSNSIIKQENIVSQIHFIRGEKVILDVDLAILYGVATKQLTRAVRRNSGRFPLDFMFQLSVEEMKILRSQFGTSSWGGRRYHPYAFTEQGVAMLSGILKSKRAIEVNVENHALVCKIAPMAFFAQRVGTKIRFNGKEI